jgi:hypothetical protein
MRLVKIEKHPSSVKGHRAYVAEVEEDGIVVSRTFSADNDFGAQHVGWNLLRALKESKRYILVEKYGEDWRKHDKGNFWSAAEAPDDVRQVFTDICRALPDEFGALL